MAVQLACLNPLGAMKRDLCFFESFQYFPSFTLKLIYLLVPFFYTQRKCLNFQVALGQHRDCCPRATFDKLIYLLFILFEYHYLQYILLYVPKAIISQKSVGANLWSYIVAFGQRGCQIDTVPFFYNKSSLQSFFSL